MDGKIADRGLLAVGDTVIAEAAANGGAGRFARNRQQRYCRGGGRCDDMGFSASH